MDDYTRNIIYYMNNTKYDGTLKTYSQRIYYKSKVCGDVVIMYVVFDNEIIKNIKYELNGCALNTASFEIFCDYLIGKRIDSIKDLHINMVKEKLGECPLGKNHCIDLALESFKLVKVN